MALPGKWSSLRDKPSVAPCAALLTHRVLTHFKNMLFNVNGQASSRGIFLKALFKF